MKMDRKVLYVQSELAFTDGVEKLDPVLTKADVSPYKKNAFGQSMFFFTL